jgi:FMN phosphatase YigB (HAD superfamily)
MTVRGPRPRVKLLVTDLDNTLWDWFQAWYSSFSAMLAKLAGLSGVPQGRLEAEMQVVHRQRHTTEYSYLLNELPSLVSATQGRPPLEIYDEAMHVLNSVRVKTTRLYPGVREMLDELNQRGVPVVAYTESIAYWTEWRIKKTGLDGLIRVLYSSPDHDLPNGISFDDIRTLPPSAYGLSETKHREVARGIVKPNARILRSIVDDFDLDPAEVVYVGDSLMKDVAMAQQVGVHDVLAAYGIAHDREEYELLRRVSHWNQEDIEREKRLAEQPDVVPTYRLTHQYSELLELFEFAGD